MAYPFTLYSEFLDGQGLGNQLWIYASIRSIARKIGADFYFAGRSNFKGSSFLDISYSSIPISVESSSSSNFSDFYERLYYDHELKYLGSFYDERVLDIKSSVKMHGLFQSEKYLGGNVSEIYDDIQVLPDILLSNPIDSKTCILNIRGGEYKKHSNFILPKLYWENAVAYMLGNFDINNLLIVTDDYRYAQALFPRLEIVSGSVSDCFASLYNAKYVIASNSTFSYFPLRLGEVFQPKTILAPAFWGRHSARVPRWASVANFYSGWKWLTVDGQILSDTSAAALAQRDESYYLSAYNVLFPQNAVPSFNYWRFLPSGLRRVAKSFLSKLFPMRY